jgi:hypothetical protein
VPEASWCRIVKEDGIFMDTGPTLPEPTPGADDWRGYPWKSVVWTLVALAIALRLYHFLRNPPVWCDELWLLRNITGMGFVEQLGPLKDVQAAPPLFLWVERLVWLGFGDNIYMLRLLPLLASCGTILLLLYLGCRWFRAAALPWAVLLLGCSHQMMSYTFEVKPYMLDCLIAVAIPALFISTNCWRLEWRLFFFGLLAPVVIFVSYPGCFVYGALLVALLFPLWDGRRQWQAWLGYGLLVLITFTAFALLVTGPIRAQRTGALDACWPDHPDLRYPWTVPLWSLTTFFGFLEHLWRPTGPVLILPILIGSISLWRRQRRMELVFLLLPAALAMMAAWIGAYPFESRLVLFAAAPLALLMGEGIVEILRWSQARLNDTKRLVAPFQRAAFKAGIILLFIVMLLPLSRTLYYLVVPLPRLTYEVWPETPNAQQSDLDMTKALSKN